MAINTNYALDLSSLLSGTASTTNATTSSSTNFSDVFNSYLQQASTTNVQEALAATDTASSTSVASLLGTNSTYSYYLNSLLNGSDTTTTEAMQTYLAQANATTDTTNMASLFGGDTQNTSSNTLANILMASYEAKQLQTVSNAQNTYETQLAQLQQQTPSAAVEQRIQKLNNNAATLQNYVQNTLLNKTSQQATSSLNGVFNSISTLQNDILAKYKSAQQATDATLIDTTNV